MSRTAATIERVAESAEEAAILAGVVDRPDDDAPRLVYADWLEEQDDLRGPLLREFVQAVNLDKRLPSLNKVNKSWADLTGLTILSKMAKCGVLKKRTQLLKHARPALRLEARAANFDRPPLPPKELGTTRLGGDPDLPRGVPFPTAADGGPLHFLGQFDLADFQGTIAGRAFPESGLLSIFRPQSDGKNCYPSNDDCPRLVRLTSAGTQLVRLPRPTDQTDPPAPFRPGLRIVETLRLPGEFRQWPGVKWTDDEISEFDGVFPTNLGGTAFILLGHVTHGNIGEEPLKKRPAWTQLILVPYMEGPDYGVSDMSLSYQLPAKDLKAGRFNRLEATFG